MNHFNHPISDNAAVQSDSPQYLCSLSCGLANGAFLRLFPKPSSRAGRYMDIDLARLKRAAVEVLLDGRTASDPEIIRQMVSLIAARRGWDPTTEKSGRNSHSYMPP